MSGLQAPERNEECARPSKDDLGAIVIDREKDFLDFDPARSANVLRALLLLYFEFCRRLRGKLEYGCFLALAQMGQENDSPVWKFERIVMHVGNVFIDLSEDCGRVAYRSPPPPRQTWRSKCHLL
jgi:hypothetical protein